MTGYHQLSGELFRGLARSIGGPAASRAFVEAQLSRHLLLIAGVLRQWPGPAAERDALVAALEAARAAGPDATAGVLGAPLVGAWAAIVSRMAGQQRAGRADFGHLGAVAVVACAAAGIDAEARVPVRDGAVAVPGLGRLVVGGGSARLAATGGVVSVDSGHGLVPVPPDGADAAGWQPVRRLRAVLGDLAIEVALDDVDPYRHGYHAPPTPRLSEAEFAEWHELFAGAWRLLADRMPHRAAEIGVGLRALVPLQGDRRSSRSATIRDVFGAFGLTRPPTAADFAVTLVHEYQHAKLSALHELTPLTRPDDGRRYFAPWRTDPRPLGGLLQGVYAFAGVADTWRALRTAEGVADTAEQQFADARLQVDRSLETVASSGALTPAGELFVTHLRRFTDGLLTVPVDGAVARLAAQRHSERYQRWLTANPA
ncbi:HEXXH motif domain-containing protein [Dactylosporangium sp. NPDC049742]|uniref:HEXXH motif domain-containing protein n=1 Tax=Dactylosporangium sp. NPDC049742 TaxID=3154737 RepID=UPI00344763A5